MKNIISVTALLFLIAGQSWADTEKYRLSFRDNPSTTISIIWNQVNGGEASVYYGLDESDPENFTEQGVDASNGAGGMENKIVRLADLEPNSVYYFYIKDDNSESDLYNFKTAPAKALGTEFSFIHGGDSRSNHNARVKSNRVVSKLRPLFVAFGGDYINTADNASWRTWMDHWQETISEDGRMYPIIAVRGNHEPDDDVHELFDTPSDRNFYGLDFAGGLLDVVALNSEIGATSNNQDDWLRTHLEEYDNSLWKFVNWHSPIAPIGPKSFQDGLWDNWAGTLYDHGVNLAGESHSHIVKRTLPLKPVAGGDGKYEADDRGTVYIGEGNWAAGPRDITNTYDWLQGTGRFHNLNWIHVSAEAMILYTVDTDDFDLGTSERDDSDPFNTQDITLWNPTGTDPGYSLTQYSFPVRGCGDPAFEEYADDVQIDDGTSCVTPVVTATDQSMPGYLAGLSLKIHVNGRGEIFFPITKERSLPAKIKIFNEKGAQIWSKVLPAGKQSIRIKLPSQHKKSRGIYYTQLTQGNKTLSKRFPVFK